MDKIQISAFELAQRFVGIKEAAGHASNPQITAMLQLDVPDITQDEVPWCSAFANYIAWLLRLPRSKSLRARSWLDVGQPVQLPQAMVGFDVVVFSRGGPVTGHVGFFAGRDTSQVYVLGGNQADAVNVAPFRL